MRDLFLSRIIRNPEEMGDKFPESLDKIPARGVKLRGTFRESFCNLNRSNIRPHIQIRRSSVSSSIFCEDDHDHQNDHDHRFDIPQCSFHSNNHYYIPDTANY